MAEQLLAATGLTKRFGAAPPALAGIDLAIAPGEIVALAGASGSGKSTLARCLLRLIRPDSGSITFAGTDLLAAEGAALLALRRRIQLVFQDPLAAFNPRATVARILADPLRLHDIVPVHARGAELDRLMSLVDLPPSLLARRPHDLSGGQRQRVAIARAIACRPDLVVLDEPVSALDVSVRARIVNLLLDLRDAGGMAYLLISHDLALVRAIAGRVAIMDAGRIVEQGPVDGVFAAPAHAATRALIAAVPRLRVSPP